MRERGFCEVGLISTWVIDQKRTKVVNFDHLPVTQRNETMADRQCIVCHDRVGPRQPKLCRHPYHRGCLRQWHETDPNWNGQCPLCRTVIYQEPLDDVIRRYRQYDRYPRVDTEPDEELTASGVRRCPACRAQFIRDGGCTWMTCRCGHGFTTTAPNLERKVLGVVPESNLLAISLITFTVLFTLLLIVSETTFRSHPECTTDQVRLSTTCDPCWHEYHIAHALLDGNTNCEPPELVYFLPKGLKSYTEWKLARCTLCDQDLNKAMFSLRSDCSRRLFIQYPIKALASCLEASALWLEKSAMWQELVWPLMQPRPLQPVQAEAGGR